MLLFRIGDTPGPKIDVTGVGELVELVQPAPTPF